MTHIIIEQNITTGSINLSMLKLQNTKKRTISTKIPHRQNSSKIKSKNGRNKAPPLRLEPIVSAICWL